MQGCTSFSSIMERATGEMPERLNGTVSKTVVALVATVGSNPTLSAKIGGFE